MPLLTYKLFIRPDLDYGDVIYGQAIQLSTNYNESYKKLIFRISLEKLDNELGVETLEKENDTGKYASSIKFIKVNLQNTYLTLFT